MRKEARMRINVHYTAQFFEDEKPVIGDQLVECDDAIKAIISFISVWNALNAQRAILLTLTAEPELGRKNALQEKPFNRANYFIGIGNINLCLEHAFKAYVSDKRENLTDEKLQAFLARVCNSEITGERGKPLIRIVKDHCCRCEVLDHMVGKTALAIDKDVKQALEGESNGK